jgi:dTDP-4-dehydrorhamnose reductase
MKVLIIGHGLLGKELVRQSGWDYISRHDNGIDFRNPETYAHHLDNYDCVLNCVANTDTYSDDKEAHWDVNYEGVANLVDLCNEKSKKLVHISTDYVYTNSKKNCKETEVPVHCPTWYGYTKLLGDAHVQLKSMNYLLIRCTHKPTPFPYEKAYVNQIGNFDYVDDISTKIISLITKGCEGVYNVGTPLKSMYGLAKRTNDDVEPINAVCHEDMPLDVSMNINKMEKELS